MGIILAEVVPFQNKDNFNVGLLCAGLETPTTAGLETGATSSTRGDELAALCGLAVVAFYVVVEDLLELGYDGVAAQRC